MDDKPTHARLNDIRDQISDLRHQITMISYEDKLWNDWLTPCVGGLTCVISTMYDAIEEIKKHHEKWGSLDKN